MEKRSNTNLFPQAAQTMLVDQFHIPGEEKRLFFKFIAELKLQMPHINDTAIGKQDPEENIWETVVPLRMRKEVPPQDAGAQKVVFG
ncbi:hypothetical protein GBA52_009330 [Prunus armeniaca]|nr:hypothetical protein GBA52_009330 [Prunus armeniaca]